MLDLESEAMTARILFILGVTLCDWIFFFSCSKASDANIGIIANVVYLWKPRLGLYMFYDKRNYNPC